MDVISAVRRFLEKDLRIANAESLAEELPLVQKGVIDSIELMQVVAFLEKEFGIEVDETEILPAHFRNLASMAAFVARKKAGSG